MATTMSASFNAEPANPEERQQQNLSPKSYADAVEEAPPVNGANGISTANGIKKSTEINGGKDEEVGHKVSVLRIVDTGAANNKNQPERPPVERQESKQEYSATVWCHVSAT